MRFCVEHNKSEIVPFCFSTFVCIFPCSYLSFVCLNPHHILKINRNITRPETFCIANIEVMSMGIPLVTFAVGGIAEYIDQDLLLHNNVNDTVHNQNLELNKESSIWLAQANFSLHTNAVVLNDTRPEVMAQAALFLIRYPKVRQAIGNNGQSTVHNYFNIPRQMYQYRQLYNELISEKHHND